MQVLTYPEHGTYRVYSNPKTFHAGTSTPRGKFPQKLTLPCSWQADARKCLCTSQLHPIPTDIRSPVPFRRRGFRDREIEAGRDLIIGGCNNGVEPSRSGLDTGAMQQQRAQTHAREGERKERQESCAAL